MFISLFLPYSLDLNVIYIQTVLTGFERVPSDYHNNYSPVLGTP